jgi:hypothetical protein
MLTLILFVFIIGANGIVQIQSKISPSTAASQTQVQKKKKKKHFSYTKKIIVF